MKNHKSLIRFIIVAVSLILLASPNSMSQDFKLFKNKKHKLGFNLGYGAQNLSMALSNINTSDAKKIINYLEGKGIDIDDAGLDVDYFYEIFYFQLQYYLSLTRGRTSSLELLFQPQYNITYFKQENDAVTQTKGYEYGLNIGFVARKNMLNDFVSFYAGISSGPHYVSGTPSRQADGFIFSSNFFAGINLRFIRNVYIDIRPGYRHISNAYFKHPNHGINNFFLNGGFFITL